MQSMSDMDWGIMAPEWVIAIACALLIVVDLFLKNTASRRWIGFLSLLAVGMAGGWVITQFRHKSAMILDGAYILAPYTLIWKIILLTGAALVLLVSLGQEKKEYEPHEGEYYYLLLTAVLGGMIVVSTADLIGLYTGLELLSLSSYILVGIQKKKNRSNEAAWKYVVLGGVSSAFILYGMSFLYGLTGTTHVGEIQKQLSQVGSSYEAYVYLSFFLMMVGFGFKLASAPFHTWAPDVYQGAPTPITSFLAIVSKSVTFALVLIVYMAYAGPYGEFQEDMIILFMIMATLSMIIGNTVALRQTNVKRMMAYSSIAHAGYVLVAVATGNQILIPIVFFYLFVYLFMTIGVFAVIALVAEQEKSEDLKAFAGLYHRSPLLALSMSVFLLSLAGIPVTAGFFGKFYIIMGALELNHIWLIAVMIVTTIISYYYYFAVIRQMYFRRPASSDPVRVSWPMKVAIGISLIATMGIGIMPQFVLETLQSLLR